MKNLIFSLDQIVLWLIQKIWKVSIKLIDLKHNIFMQKIIKFFQFTLLYHNKKILKILPKHSGKFEVREVKTMKQKI